MKGRFFFSINHLALLSLFVIITTENNVMTFSLTMAGEIKKTAIIFLFILFSGCLYANAQPNDFKPPVPLPYLREADMMWCRRIWRVIDLDEKLNNVLKYPAYGDSRELKSLITVLYDAVMDGMLIPYDPVDDEFSKVMSLEEFKKRGGAGMDTISVPVSTDNPDIIKDTVVRREFRFDQVVQYRIKEDVFFDKEKSVMETRIIGIAPLIYDLDDQGNIREDSKPIPVCWFYFPEARTVLSKNLVFNRQNDKERRTFDDIFIKRIFSSHIIKESNEFNRRIEDYKTNPIDALLESERIKSEILSLENDMWEY